jgi:hypothetical protein
MIAPHPHERPLRAAVILVSALFWAGFALLLWTLWEKLVPALSSTDVVLLIGVVAIVSYVAAWLRRAARAVGLMGHAVEIGPDQHPDLHARVRACAKRLGFTETPVAFLFQQPHPVLTYSLRHWGRDYLALNGELVGALTDHQGAIDFFIGHELGRLHDPDRNWVWLLLPGRVLPLLGPAYARAKVYSYDRHGIGACRNRVDAALAVALVASGSRRWKSFSVSHYAQQSLRKDAVFDFFEIISGAPYLSRRSAHLRGVATGDGARSKRHPLAWALGAVTPGVTPFDRGALARALFATLWLTVAIVAGWHLYTQLSLAGLVTPLESRFENKIVAIKNPGPETALPPPSKAIETDVYARLDADLKRLGTIALTRYRKLGRVPCEIGQTAALDLNFIVSRYAFSCDEPIVYTVVETGEFEPGRGAHLRSYDWKDNRFSTSLSPTAAPTSATPAPTEKGPANP